MPSPSVLIVGAGSVGLTTALALQYGRLPASGILVVDQRPSRDLSTVQNRALAVSASTLEVFRCLGIAERFLSAGLPLRATHFGGGRRALDLNYNMLGTKYPFNMIIPQTCTEDILLRRCEEVGISFAWGRQLTGLAQWKRGHRQRSWLCGTSSTRAPRKNGPRWTLWKRRSMSRLSTSDGPVVCVVLRTPLSLTSWLMREWRKATSWWELD